MVCCQEHIIEKADVSLDPEIVWTQGNSLTALQKTIR